MNLLTIEEEDVVTVRFKESGTVTHGRSVCVGPNLAATYPEVYELVGGFRFKPSGEARVCKDRLPFRLSYGRALILDEDGLTRTVPAEQLELVGTA